jgi:hypothetical protein
MHGRFEQARLVLIGWIEGREGAKWKRPGMVLEVGNQVEESGWGEGTMNCCCTLKYEGKYNARTSRDKTSKLAGHTVAAQQWH